jgi:hypothetical protein
MVNVELDTVFEGTKANTTNMTASNNITTNPNPVGTSNNDDLPVKVEGQTNASMMKQATTIVLQLTFTRTPWS